MFKGHAFNQLAIVATQAQIESQKHKEKAPEHSQPSVGVGGLGGASVLGSALAGVTSLMGDDEPGAQALHNAINSIYVLYYYARSLAASSPFSPATHNLSALLRAKFSMYEWLTFKYILYYT